MTNTRNCPKCNQPNPPEAAVCSSCGAELVRYCPSCGAPRPWYVAACPNCQADLQETAQFADLFRANRSGVLRSRYTLLDKIASGAVSAVYRAADVNHANRLYAVKELSTISLFRPDERREAVARLSRAIERWSQVRHPGLARVVDAFRERDRYYVVSEYVYGWSASQLLTEASSHIPPELVRNWGAQVADLLEHLHTLTDPLFVPFLSPAHLIVNPEGQVRLVGYGLGYYIRPTTYGPYGGLPGYGAPELSRQSPDSRTDIFSLGRVLYALLIGQPLERGVPKGTALDRAVPGISKQLVRVVAQAATSRRERRYERAADLASALREGALGPMEPVYGWHEQSGSALASHLTRQSEGQPSEQHSMEALGYARDPRFGPRPEPTAAALSTPTLPASSSAKLSASPTRLTLRDLPPNAPRRAVLAVRNAGGDQLTFRVASQVPWIKAPSREVSLSAGQQARVVVTVDPQALPAERVNETQALLLESNVGRLWIAASIQIRTAPALSVDQDSLDFGEVDAPQSLEITVRNQGRERLEGQIVSQVPWLEPSPALLRVQGGASATLTVRLRPERMPDGPQTVAQALLLDTNGGQSAIAAQAWRPNPHLEIAGGIDLGNVNPEAPVTDVITVSNSGDGALRGTVRSLVPWLQVSPETVQCAAGESLTLQITADTTGLGDGTVQLPQGLRVQTNGGAATLWVRLNNRAPRLEVQMALLDFGQITLGQTVAQDLVIRNSGSADLYAAVNSALDWVHTSERSVQCAPGESQIIRVTLDSSLLPRGGLYNEPIALRISSGADMQMVGLNALVLQPELTAQPMLVDFGYLDPLTPGAAEVLLTNTGTGELAWHAQSDVEWLEIEPTSGRCAEGEAASVQLRAYALGLEAGHQQASGSLAITSDAGRIKIPLRVALAAPRIAMDRTFVDLGISVNRENVAAAVRIFNRGLGLLRGTAMSDRLWLVTGRTSFECDTGHSIELSLGTDMDEFPEDLSEDRAVVSIESNGGATEIDVRVQIERRPMLREPEPVQLRGGERPQGRLVLWNDGMAPAMVDLQPTDVRLGISRSDVQVKQGKSVRISVSWDGSQPPEAPVSIGIRSADQEWQVPVEFTTST
ncbi:MAG: BACON domain-containing protein [Anaerolineae bacterium]|jgi:serine/threonine protein kinase/tRNA threonylcarbamoyladenosine modification (KEOPS) complex  Pcc1 subunit